MAEDPGIDLSQSGAQRTGDDPQLKMTEGQRRGTSGVPLGTNVDPRIVERSADRFAIASLMGFTVAILLVEVLSAFTEAGRGIAIDPGKFALWEVTSVAVIVALLPFLPGRVSQGFPGVHPVSRVLVVHGLGVAAFSALHILGMVALRKMLHPVLYGGPYIFSDNLPRELIYEFRKDALTYVMAAAIIVLVREIAAGRKALADAKRAASPQMLTYRSGGRTVMIPAAAILSARAEGNYAVLETATGNHFVRTTLKALLDDLAAAGVEAARVHRSHIVVLSAVREATPTGHGALVLRLVSGGEVPVSRRYREALPFP